MSIESLLPRIFDEFLAPVLLVLVMLSLMWFLWGIAEFIKDADSQEGRSKGKRNMIWGVVGMFIIVSTFGIIQVIEATLPGDIDRPDFPAGIEL